MNKLIAKHNSIIEEKAKNDPKSKAETKTPLEPIKLKKKTSKKYFPEISEEDSNDSASESVSKEDEEEIKKDDYSYNNYKKQGKEN